MGVGTADTIAARLVAAGRDPATPVAVIENGTRANEISAFGALGNVADVIYSAGINGPALLIIGEVVALAQPRQTAAPPGKAESRIVIALGDAVVSSERPSLARIFRRSSPAGFPPPVALVLIPRRIATGRKTFRAPSYDGSGGC